MNKLKEVVDFWNKRPCNVLHSPKEIGTKEYFEEVSARKYKVEPHIKKFADFSKWKNKKVLEIGCGIGTDAQSFAEAGAIYTGVDLSKESIKLAKQRFKIFNLSGDFYEVTDEKITNIVPIQEYDLIYSFGVIHHTPNPKLLLQELESYMSDTTLLKIMLYAKNSWKSFMIEAGLDQPEAQYGCPIANTYTEEDINNLLSNYNIISIEQDHIFPYEIESYKKYEYKIVDWFSSMPYEMFSILEKKIGWHMLITANLK
jgi:SAM-dependent methyltransferase